VRSGQRSLKRLLMAPQAGADGSTGAGSATAASPVGGDQAALVLGAGTVAMRSCTMPRDRVGPQGQNQSCRPEQYAKERG
jgi:hypothetical protein